MTPRVVRAGLRPGFVSPLASGLGRRLVILGDAVAYSSSLAALIGGSMTWAVGRALAAPGLTHDLALESALVATGTFVVYNVDRLRDLPRDASSSPRRSAFVGRHRRALAWATGTASLALVALFATATPPTVVLCLVVGAIGLLHRRLKHDVRLKVAYVAAAWTAACVGLPWLAGSETIGALAWSLVIVGSGVTANLIASNLREGKHPAAGRKPEAALLLARMLALVGLAAAAIAPDRLAALAGIPAAEAVALVFFRRSERFGHLVVDGALLLGALVVICSATGGTA